MKGLRKYALLGSILTLAIVAVLIVSGPALAMTLGLVADSEVEQGDTEHMTMTAHIASNERLPLYWQSVEMTGPDGFATKCYWWISDPERTVHPYGVMTAEGLAIASKDVEALPHADYDCSNIRVEISFSPTEGYMTPGRLYGYRDDGYGYGFGYGFGYGYGYGEHVNTYDVDVVTDIYFETDDNTDLGDYTATGYTEAWSHGPGNWYEWTSDAVGFEVFRYYHTTGGPSNGYQPSTPNVYDVEGNLVSTGTANVTGLKIGDSFTWTMDGETHTGKILSIGAGYVVIQISSDPQNVKVLTGETKQVDVDGDGTMDISVTLNGITSGKTDLTIVDLSWTTPSAAEMPPAATPPAAQPGTQPTTQPTAQQPAADYTLITAIVVILIVVVALGYMAKKKTKKK